MNEIQTLSFKGVVFAILATIQIPEEEIGYLLLVIFLDSIFGVIKSIKLGIPIRFNYFIWGIVSKLSVMLIPFLLAIFAAVFKHDLSYLIDAFIYLIAANESLAIITKIATIRTGVEYKNEDFIARGIESIRTFFIEKLDGVIKKPNEKN